MHWGSRWLYIHAVLTPWSEGGGVRTCAGGQTRLSGFSKTRTRNAESVDFRGRGDDFREKTFIGVQTHGLPRSTYDAFMYTYKSVEIKKEDMKQSRK